MIDWTLAREMISIGKRLYDNQLIVATEGNFSVRIDDRRVLATPRGLCKGELLTDDLVLANINGKHLSGKHRASTEIALHLEAYKQRKDVKACIHAHPPSCISLMLAGGKLDKPLLPEGVVLLGKVPTVPYALPSTQQVAESIKPFIQKTDCLLLDRHGSLTLGTTLNEAYRKLELMEHTAQVYMRALALGNVRELSQSEVDALMNLRKSTYGLNYPIIPFD